MMINNAQINFHHFCIVSLMLEQHIISDFFFSQDVDDNKKIINLCMKLN